MEEMNKELMENTVTEMVEEVSDKLTFKENCIAYALTGVFVTGAVTLGYLGYKGAKKLTNKIKDKKKLSEQSEDEEAVVDVEDVQDIDYDGTEE